MLAKREVIASLQLLMAVARADGELQPSERDAIMEALRDVELPEGYTVDRLLNEEVVLESIISEIKTEEGRKNAFKAAYLMAHADSDFNKAEQHVIDLLKRRWSIQEEEVEELDTGLEIADTTLISNISVSDVAERDASANRKVHQYLVLTTLAGAVPIPLIGDLMVAPLQMAMVYELGIIYHHNLDKAAIKAMLGTFGVGKGLRIAISSLAKLIPGWGSIVGAVGAFSTTYALAQVCRKYFESGGQVSLDSLKDFFTQKKEEGKRQYEQQKETIAANNAEVAKEITEIGTKLKTGELKLKDYDQRICELTNKVN